MRRPLARGLGWLMAFAISILAGAALANDFMMMGLGSRATGGGPPPTNCVLLEDTSKLLLEDASGCISLE